MVPLSPKTVDKSVGNSAARDILAYKNGIFIFLPKKQARQIKLLFFNNIFVAEL